MLQIVQKTLDGELHTAAGWTAHGATGHLHLWLH